MPILVVKLPIIVYHSIDRFGTLISTAPEDFQRQIRWLADHGWRSIRLSDAAERIRQGRPIPSRSVALTFDDAMPSIRDIADPILRDHGFTATTFVITGQVGQRPHWYRLAEPYRREPLLDVDDLKRLQDRGWELHPHTHDHPVLSHLDFELQAEQISRSRGLIEQWFGTAGDVLAYPFGQYDARTLEAMRRCGMVMGLTLEFSCRLEPGRILESPRLGSAWFKSSNFRQALAMAGLFERYVYWRGRFRKGRARHFQNPTPETTQGLQAVGQSAGS